LLLECAAEFARELYKLIIFQLFDEKAEWEPETETLVFVTKEIGQILEILDRDLKTIRLGERDVCVSIGNGEAEDCDDEKAGNENQGEECSGGGGGAEEEAGGDDDNEQSSGGADGDEAAGSGDANGGGGNGDKEGRSGEDDNNANRKSDGNGDGDDADGAKGDEQGDDDNKEEEEHELAKGDANALFFCDDSALSTSGGEPVLKKYKPAPGFYPLDEDIAELVEENKQLAQINKRLQEQLEQHKNERKIRVKGEKMLLEHHQRMMLERQKAVQEEILSKLQAKIDREMDPEEEMSASNCSGTDEDDDGQQDDGHAGDDEKSEHEKDSVEETTQNEVGAEKEELGQLETGELLNNQ